MNKEEIIRLLHESVKGHPEYTPGCTDPEGEDLEVLVKFAELVAQQAIADALVGVSHAVAEEREACAKACDTLNEKWQWGEECAAAIRSRK